MIEFFLVCDALFVMFVPLVIVYKFMFLELCVSLSQRSTSCAWTRNSCFHYTILVIFFFAFPLIICKFSRGTEICSIHNVPKKKGGFAARVSYRNRLKY